MAIIFIALIILTALASFYYAPIFRKYISDDHTKYTSYFKKEFLLSAEEQDFFRALEEAVKGEYLILPKLDLSNLVHVGNERHWEYSPTDPTVGRHVDFAIFYRESFTPKLVIELDHNVHNSPGVHEAEGGHGSHSAHAEEEKPAKDHFVDEVLNKVGIRVVHMKVSHFYNTEEIAKLIA